MPDGQNIAAEQAVRVGRVVSVSGSTARGMLDASSNDSANTTVRIGGLLKIATPRSVLFGVVSTLGVDDPMLDRGHGEKQFVEIELLGEAVGARIDSTKLSFQRGVSDYPTLGAPIHLAVGTDLAQVYARPSETNVCVGALFQDDQVPAYLITDELLGKHFAVLGTTGVGKSCALALVLRAILAENPSGHIVLLDPHNEYSQAFADRAEMLSPEDLQLPYWLLNFEEVVQVLIGDRGADTVTQAAILKEAIVAAKIKFAGDGASVEHITVDTPVPYRLGDLMRILDEGMGQLDKPENSVPYLRLKARIESLKADRRYGFMFSGLVVRDNLADILARILRIPVDGKPLTVVDLSGVPSEIVDVVVSVLCRMIFDFAVWSAREHATPVLLVCEEAQRYVPSDESLGFAPTRRVISQIAKEGRKYGVALCLVSQRPSELSSSILSQCNTLFALRMSNDQDQDFVSRALPESAKGFLGALASLRTRDAIVVGEGVSVPMRLRFNELASQYQPRSSSAAFSEAWRSDEEPRALIADTIARWRLQQR